MQHTFFPYLFSWSLLCSLLTYPLRKKEKEEEEEEEEKEEEKIVKSTKTDP